MYIGNKQESFYILYKATLQCTHEGIRLCSKGNEMGGAGVWLSNKASHCESAEGRTRVTNAGVGPSVSAIHQQLCS